MSAEQRQAARHFVTRDLCPGCGARDFAVVYSRSYQDPDIVHYLRSHYDPQGHIELDLICDATFKLARCNACGMVFQVDIPDDSLMEKLYEQWIDPQKIYQIYDGVMPTEAYRGAAEEILSLVLNFNRPPHELKFFDFGMGWGMWCRMALGFGVDAYGTELSQSRIDHARKFGVKVITWDEIPQHQFHFINTEQVFEHIPNPLETLKHLKRGLRPEGMIRISVPNPSDVDYRLRHLDWHAHRDALNSASPIHPLEHINCFTHDAIVKMGQAAGLVKATLPITIQYAASTNWRPVKMMLKNLARPWLRNYRWKRTNVLLKQR